MRIFLLVLIFYSCMANAQIPKTITIDVKRNDKLKLSQISSEVIKIPLKAAMDLQGHEIWKIILLRNYIYILEGSEETKGWPERALQFDISGNFIRQIGSIDPRTKTYLKVKNISCDEEKGILILDQADGFSVFDPEGNFKYRLKNVPAGSVYFNGCFYTQDIKAKNERLESRLFYMNINNQERKEIPVPRSIPDLKDEYEGRGFDYSKKDGQLYISFGYDLKIYRLNKTELVPVYKFNFENCILSSLNIPPAPKQFVFGNYIQYGYWLKNSPYGQNIFIYDTRTSKSYNVQLRFGNGMMVSGIEDDINHTGFFQLGLTNREGYVYFVKKANEAKRADGSSNPVIFLAKLK